MLKHANGGDLVKRRLTHAELQVAVILQANLHLVAQAGVRHPLKRQRLLLPGQRDTHHLGAVLLRRPYRQCAPAATNVQQALAGLEHDLVQDVVQLGALRLFQCFVLLRKIGAGIHHVRVQPQAVKVVGHVVVVLNGLRILRLVAPHRAEDAGKAPLHGHRHMRQLRGRLHHVMHPALHIKVAVHIALGQVVQAGRHKVLQGARAGQLHRHARVGSQVVVGAVPQRQPQGNRVCIAQPRRDAPQQFVGGDVGD